MIWGKSLCVIVFTWAMSGCATHTSEPIDISGKANPLLRDVVFFELADVKLDALLVRAEKAEQAEGPKLLPRVSALPAHRLVCVDAADRLLVFWADGEAPLLRKNVKLQSVTCPAALGKLVRQRKI
jgi:hypothetical protein